MLKTTFNFDNSFIRELPGDPKSGAHPRQVYGAAYSIVEPTPVRSPRLIAYSREIASLLGIEPADIESPAFAQVFAGNRLLEGMQPYAANYGGHQFGQWAGQLGDGRAITLGEIIDSMGSRWELQLKGAGPTPYARSADGRAVLRSSVREFLCSEAMHHLGIPTTRALSLVATGERVVRDMFYDGHPRLESGAIVCRVAPSFIRFGTFELPAARSDLPLLKQLINFTICRDFPELDSAYSMDSSDLAKQELYANWFGEVCRRTARMVAHWMRVGFVHGVMNTDNMSILGLTIDYGPYGWIDNFDLDWTPNTTDADGRRYRYGNQPQVAYWNLTRLASALAPAFDSPDGLNAGLQQYVEVFGETNRGHIAAKFGLVQCLDEDVANMEKLQELLQRAEVDMTLFFRALADVDPDAPTLAPLESAFYDEVKRRHTEPEFTAWLECYCARVRHEGSPLVERRSRMQAANPRYVLRNYLAQQAIDRAERGEESGISELLEVLRRPYTDQLDYDHFAQRRPDWARNRPGCSMLSCSS